MKGLPIPFKGPMVRAIRDGRKTVTRRLVKPMRGEQSKWLTAEMISRVPHGEMVHSEPVGWQMHHPQAGTRKECAPGKFIDVEHDSPLGWIRSPYGGAGDRLWVRETWAKADGRHTLVPLLYRADGDSQPVLDARWRPSIHMPRWASRITLEVTDVRVERLHDITEDDARAEGVSPPAEHRDGNLPHVAEFSLLWDRINGDRAAWATNPWVWRIAFRRTS